MTAKQRDAFDPQAFLDSSGVARTIVLYRRAEVIFAQGDPCQHVLYIQKGSVKVSVHSPTGREGVVAMLGQGEFFGEGCLAGQPARMGSATAMTASTILLVEKAEMVRLLHKQHAFSDRFIAHMLARNIRIEEDLVDQLFNSSEKRLARTLLLLARYGRHGEAPLPIVSASSPSGCFDAGPNDMQMLWFDAVGPDEAMSDSRDSVARPPRAVPPLTA